MQVVMVRSRWELSPEAAELSARMEVSEGVEGSEGVTGFRAGLGSERGRGAGEKGEPELEAEALE
jgi:hypothetical protein